MRLHSRKSIINYVPEGRPPRAEQRKVNIALYLYVFGLFLIVLYIFYIFYTKIKYIEFMGFIQVPKVVIKADREEIVDKIFIKDGCVVKKDEPLFLVKRSFERVLPPSVSLNLKSRLEELKIKLSAVRSKLKQINSPEIIKIKNQILSLKTQIALKESLLKAMRRIVNTTKKSKDTKRLLELSTLNPESLESLDLNLEKIKAAIVSLRRALKSLEDEKRFLEESERSYLLLKEEILNKNISFIKKQIKNINNSIFKTEVKNTIRSPLVGEVKEVDVIPHQVVAKGESLAVVVPLNGKVRFQLFTGQKKAKYLKKGLKFSLLLPSGRTLEGTMVDIHSGALKYQPKLTKDYWPVASPVVGIIEVRNPPGNLMSLDGVKVKIIIKRKLWNIF